MTLRLSLKTFVSRFLCIQTIALAEFRGCQRICTFSTIRSVKWHTYDVCSYLPELADHRCGYETPSLLLREEVLRVASRRESSSLVTKDQAALKYVSGSFTEDFKYTGKLAGSRTTRYALL
jgi:hypothetical protein